MIKIKPDCLRTFLFSKNRRAWSRKQVILVLLHHRLENIFQTEPRRENGDLEIWWSEHCSENRLTHLVIVDCSCCCWRFFNRFACSTVQLYFASPRLLALLLSFHFYFLVRIFVACCWTLDRQSSLRRIPLRFDHLLHFNWLRNKPIEISQSWFSSTVTINIFGSISLQLMIRSWPDTIAGRGRNAINEQGIPASGPCLTFVQLCSCRICQNKQNIQLPRTTFCPYFPLDLYRRGTRAVLIFLRTILLLCVF